MNILQIKSSILGENSKSSKYAGILLEKISSTVDTITVRDLDLAPVTALNSRNLSELNDPNSKLSLEHNALINQLQISDIVVICAPMYNFNIPSSLKDYFDAVTKAGITFKYDGNGNPKGLLENKKTYVVLTRGGEYKKHGLTFQEDYLKMQLNFIGLTDLQFLYVEGVATGTSEETLNSNFINQLK